MRLGATRPATMLLHSPANETKATSRPTGNGSRTSPTNPADRKCRCVHSRTWGRAATGLDGRRHASAVVAHGRELFYYVAPDTIMAVSVRLGGTSRWERLSRSSKGRTAPTLNGRHYDVSADGQRFLILKDAPPPNEQNSVAPEIHVVVNWVEELKRLVPVN